MPNVYPDDDRWPDDADDDALDRDDDGTAGGCDIATDESDEDEERARDDDARQTYDVYVGHPHALS